MKKMCFCLYIILAQNSTCGSFAVELFQGYWLLKCGVNMRARAVIHLCSEYLQTRLEGLKIIVIHFNERNLSPQRAEVLSRGST